MTMRILFVISDLTYRAAAKQLTLVVANLPPERFERRICVLGAAGPWAERLQKAGVIVDVLGWRRALDLAALNRSWHALRAYRPDVLHVWGQSALRVVALAGGLHCGRLVATAPMSPRKPMAHLAWWDRWLLRQAESVTVFRSSEAEQWQQLGLDPRRLIAIPPAVETGVDGICTADLDSRAQPTILCIGRLERHKGFRDAIWVLDMLRFLHPGLHLAFVGSGSDRHAIEDFARAARVTDRVQFLGDHPDVPALLTRAQIVWAPCRADGSLNAVLEAMAAGRPVVASQFPALAEIVRNGQTGFLVPPGDQAALARQTRTLLDNADLRRDMGEAARRRVAERFGVAEMVRRFLELYESGKSPPIEPN